MELNKDFYRKNLTSSYRMLPYFDFIEEVKEEFISFCLNFKVDEFLLYIRIRVFNEFLDLLQKEI